MKGKNRMYVFFMVLLLSFSPVCVFAKEAKEAAPLCITSGLDLEQEVRETTFERYRLIYGEAPPNAEISLSVGRLDSEGVVTEEYQETLTVGSLGMFSFSIPLELGVNYITLYETAKGYEDASYEACIKRYSQKVKKELQKMTALPGATTGIR